MAMKNHVESNHVALLQIFLEDATFEFPKSPLYREPSKKKVNVSPFNIFGFFSSSFKFKKDDLTRSSFVENPMFVVKGLLLMKIVESIWLQRMAYRLCLWVVFPSKKAFVEEIFPNLVDETMNTYVVHALVDYLLATCTFDL
jgi:hypothetical protein